MNVHIAPAARDYGGLVAVFGEPASASQVEENFLKLGYAIFPRSKFIHRLPRFSDPSFSPKLRDLLTDMAKEVDMLHPGVSAWGNRAELYQIGQDIGLFTVTPVPRLVTMFSNIANLLFEADRLKIPNLLVTTVPFSSLSELKQSLKEDLSFPYVIKNVKGNGLQMGIKVIANESELDEIPLWVAQNKGFAGECTFVLERYLDSSTYLNLPFARFSDGSINYFPMIDSSLYHDDKRLIEICPPADIKAIEVEIKESSGVLLNSISFVGVGSLEFLVSGDRHYLIGGTSGLSPNFHLWEKSAQTNAVAWQLAALGSGPRPEINLKSGHSVAAHIYAENVQYQIPAPGTVRVFDLPSAERKMHYSAEITRNVFPGEEIPFDSDGFVGSACVHARTISDAFLGLRETINDIFIAGSLQTNESYLTDVLSHPWVQEGYVHSAFLEEEFVPNYSSGFENKRFFAALVKSVLGSPIDSWWVNETGIKLDGTVSPQPQVFSSGQNNKKDHSESTEFDFYLGQVKWNGSNVRFSVERAAGRFHVRVSNQFYVVRESRINKGSSLEKGVYSISALTGGKIHALMFREGAIIPAHEPVFILESLKKLVPHSLPIKVRLKKVLVSPESHVAQGDSIVEVVRA